MSGPKCSRIDIEQQTKEQIAALRKRLTEIVADALCELKALEQEARSYARSHTGLADASQDMESIIERASADVRSAGRFEFDSDIPAAERYLAEAAERTRAVAQDAQRALVPHVERVRITKARAADRRSITAFSEAIAQEDGALADAAAALDALFEIERERRSASNERVNASKPWRAEAAGSTREIGTAHDGPRSAQQSPPDSTAPSAAPEKVAELARTVDDIRMLISRAQTLESDRTALSGIARAISQAIKEAKDAGRALTPAEIDGLLSQARIIRARISAQDEPIAKARARIDALEASLGSAAGGRPPAFKNADAVFARLDHLEAIARERDEHRYIRACIDDVMRKHGYDVVRSVELSAAAPDEHLLFTSSDGAHDGQTGIHAFVADSGDMMLEVVGVAESDDARRDRMHAASDSAQRSDLMAAQTQFCSVYAEMEEDLARLGIVNKVRHKAPPDVRHCKTITLATAGGRGLDASRIVYPGENARTRSQDPAPAAKKPARNQHGSHASSSTNPGGRPTARRRAESPRARRMG